GVNPGLYKKLPYDSLVDLAPITQIAYAPQILVVSPTLKAQSVKDLIALARSKAGRVELRCFQHRRSNAARGRAFQSERAREDDADPVQRRACNALRSDGRTYRPRFRDD